MGCLTNYWENLLLDHVLKNDPCSCPTALYLALFTGAPVTGPTEVVDIASVEVENPASPSYGYSRASLGVGASSWSLTGRSASNASGISFDPVSGGDWGIVTHYGIMTSTTAQTEASMIVYGAFDSSTTVLDGNTVTVGAGLLTLTVDTGVFSTYLAQAWIRHLLGGGGAYEFAQPANLYAGLSYNNPGSTGDGISEPESAAGYTRVNHNSWDVSVAGVTENTGALSFPQASQAYGQAVNYVFISTSATLGETATMLMYGPLNNAPLTVAASATLRFDDGALTIGLG